MDTTTGMTSLQETLQTDRALLANSDEPATVALADLKPPSFKPHPWVAMTAALGRTAPLEPLATAAPAAFYYVRFRTISHLIRLREELDGGIAPALAGMGEGADYDLAARYEGELGLRQGPLTKLLGPTVVDDLAVVGSDPYLREGSDLSFVFRVRARPAFEAALAGTLAAFGAAHGGLKTATIDHQGTPITVTRSNDGVVRRHRATVGGFDVVSNSLAATKRVIDAAPGASRAWPTSPTFATCWRATPTQPATCWRSSATSSWAKSSVPARRCWKRAGRSRSPSCCVPVTRRCSTAGCTAACPPARTRSSPSGLLKREELAHAGGEPHRLAAGAGRAFVVGRGR
jgi:hypothetical protein